MQSVVVSTSGQSVPASTSDLQIQPARLEDMPTVAALVRSSADWYRPFVSDKDMAEHEVGEAWQRTNFARRSFYVGRVENEAVGTISTQVLGAYAYLGYIYLDVDHVGKGYGHRLMKFAEHKLRQQNLRGMSLIAHPEAKWATKAYLKYGFRLAASDKADVLAWQNGVLEPYYEEGFQLYLFDFSRTWDLD